MPKILTGLQQTEAFLFQDHAAIALLLLRILTVLDGPHEHRDEPLSCPVAEQELGGFMGCRLREDKHALVHFVHHIDVSLVDEANSRVQIAYIVHKHIELGGENNAASHKEDIQVYFLRVEGPRIGHVPQEETRREANRLKHDIDALAARKNQVVIRVDVHVVDVVVAITSRVQVKDCDDAAHALDRIQCVCQTA
eukprot:CAMPEP_0185597798 /NCGR_PEP_ID=MMETSP0434-20130131/81591_1 /TAXON_ID=626734 ORGANISM="Favella taraikaensis, Strain Fe Narragansett Bay" /NCGR_SAMPLE_ID=MMETSP0434 /ASSEMBLY_ACC=CAM_ASM_000379 /LENGTH=194 /DNA_ID=CAMNT_0028226613 /DNA_START=2133 /DNA_END=2713 /DNA_ORIENTATION=+